MASNGVAVEEIMRLKEVPKRTLDIVPTAHLTFLRSSPLSTELVTSFSPLRVHGQMYHCFSKLRIIYFGFERNF